MRTHSAIMRAIMVSLVLLSACGERDPVEEAVPTSEAAPPKQRLPQVQPSVARPGAPTPSVPLPAAADTDKTAAGAAQTARRYYALIQAGDYDAAWRLRDGGADRAAFVASFAAYAEYHANVGQPSVMRGAAGSSYVEVPVHTYGRMKDGKPFSTAGTVTLRRVNDVPGSTAAQRRWRIYVGG